MASKQMAMCINVYHHTGSGVEEEQHLAHKLETSTAIEGFIFTTNAHFIKKMIQATIQ